jgi:hypothetical protein
MKLRAQIALAPIARGIDCDKSTAIPLSLHLDRDLGLSPLKLVLVALDIEAGADITLLVEKLPSRVSGIELPSKKAVKRLKTNIRDWLSRSNVSPLAQVVAGMGQLLSLRQRAANSPEARSLRL